VTGGVIFDEAGARRRPPPPPPPRKVAKKRVPTILADDATPPRPRGSNRQPAYPEEARKKGIEGMVEIEIVIDESGNVQIRRVRSGAEPFVAAALAAIQTWRYEPATRDGQTIPVHRVVRVPFRLKRGA
jgi:protein TonB